MKAIDKAVAENNKDIEKTELFKGMEGSLADPPISSRA